MRARRPHDVYGRTYTYSVALNSPEKARAARAIRCSFAALARSVYLHLGVENDVTQ